MILSAESPHTPRALALASLVTLAGCSSETPSAEPVVNCLDAGTIDTSCQPAYEPTYDQVFAATLKPSCAKSGVSCHAATGKQGGLAFEDPDEAFSDLATTRVIQPGQPECSEIVRRLTADSGKVRMPPGRSLPANEQCAVIRWIQNGAKR